MAEQEMDEILARTERALAQLDKAQGRRVMLPRAEVELLEQLEAARDLMMSVVQSKERSALTRIFGGDCVRVSRVRAVLDAVKFRRRKDRDLRVRSCFNACESVEQVLGDLGLGFALRLAQAREKQLLEQRRSICQAGLQAAEAPATALGPEEADMIEEAEEEAELELGQEEAFGAEEAFEEAEAEAEAEVGGVDDRRRPAEEALPQERREAWTEEAPQDLASDAEGHPVAEACTEDSTCLGPAPQETGRGAEEEPSVLPRPFLRQEESEDEARPVRSVGSIFQEAKAEAEEEEDFEEEESTVLPEPLEEERLMSEQLEEEAASATPAAKSEEAWPEKAGLARTPSFEQAAAALRDIVQPACPSRPAGGEPEAEPVVVEPGASSCASPGRQSLEPVEAEVEAEAEAEAYVVREEDSDPGILELPDWLERLLQRLFTFYAGTDGTSAGAGIGLTRFRSFLRDAGLLKASGGSGEASSPSQQQGSDLSTARRRPSWSGLGSGGGSSSSSSAQAKVQPFPEAPLTLVQADIMHVTARERQPVNRSYMNVDAFFWVVADIAMHCHHRQLLVCRGNPNDIVGAFGEAVLVPLSNALGLGEEELRVAIALNEEAGPLFQRARSGLLAAFSKHARGSGSPEPFRRGFWTMQALRRFAGELDLVAEMSHSALQRVFDTCVQYEVAELQGCDGMLSFAGFRLAFTMIALRVHNAPESSLIERLALLMLRLGAAHGALDVSTAARSVLGAPAKGRRGSAGTLARPLRRAFRTS